VQGTDPVKGIDDSAIFPPQPGKTLVFLEKEALLARLTDLRSARNQAIVDRFFHLSRNQSYYYTNVYVMAEVFTTVRYGTSAQEAAQVKDDILASNIEIRHGSDAWDTPTPSNTPKDVFLAAAELFAQREKIAFNFQEATLVLEAARADADFIFSYDGTVATLAWSFDIDILPYDAGVRSEPA
jgi:hypothetical protein